MTQGVTNNSSSDFTLWAGVSPAPVPESQVRLSLGLGICWLLASYRRGVGTSVEPRRRVPVSGKENNSVLFLPEARSPHSSGPPAPLGGLQWLWKGGRFGESKAELPRHQCGGEMYLLISGRIPGLEERAAWSCGCHLRLCSRLPSQHDRRTPSHWSYREFSSLDEGLPRACSQASVPPK